QGASSIILNEGGLATAMNIQTISNGSFRIYDFGGGTTAINPTSGQSLTFSGATAGFGLFGGPSVITSSGGITISSGVLIFSDIGSITFNVNGGTTFTNNGSVLTSAAAGASPTILVQNTSGGFTIAGTGLYFQANANPGLTEFYANGTITVP